MRAGAVVTAIEPDIEPSRNTPLGAGSRGPWDADSGSLIRHEAATGRIGTSCSRRPFRAQRAEHGTRPWPRPRATTASGMRITTNGTRPLSSRPIAAAAKSTAGYPQQISIRSRRMNVDNARLWQSVRSGACATEGMDSGRMVEYPELGLDYVNSACWCRHYLFSQAAPSVLAQQRRLRTEINRTSRRLRQSASLLLARRLTVGPRE